MHKNMRTYDPDGARRRCRAAHGSAGGRRTGVQGRGTLRVLKGYSTKGTQPRVLNQGYSTKGAQPRVLNQRVLNQGYSTEGTQRVLKAAAKRFRVLAAVLVGNRWNALGSVVHVWTMVVHIGYSWGTQRVLPATAYSRGTPGVPTLRGALTGGGGAQRCARHGAQYVEWGISRRGTLEYSRRTRMGPSAPRESTCESPLRRAGSLARPRSATETQSGARRSAVALVWRYGVLTAHLLHGVLHGTRGALCQSDRCVPRRRGVHVSRGAGRSTAPPWCIGVWV
jgi:hypothetical protein